MELALFQSIIDQLSPTTFIVNLYLQGEPLLNPAIGEFIRYAHTKRLYTILSTNGQLLNRNIIKKLVNSGLSKIIISLDGVTEQSYAAYRVGGSLQKVLEGIENLCQEKLNANSKLPLVELQFIAFEHNQHEINELKNITRRYSVDKLTIKTAQIINPQSNVRSATQRDLTRYVNNPEGQYMKGRSYRHCFKIWHSMVLTWDGSAAPCCYDKDLTHSHGNIGQASVDELWRGQSIQNFRKKIVTENEPFEMCSNCPENRKWLI
jgi:radical SAM protein with 4Fe4S-binding SPASM domain